jgi:hypothetical protein
MPCSRAAIPGPSTERSSRKITNKTTTCEKLELVLIPVSDVDRARDFYTQVVGFALEVDGSAGEDRAGDPARVGLFD